MSAPELESYSIGEFVSYKLVKDPQSGTFTITLTGKQQYALLIAHKVANLTVSSAELEELGLVGNEAAVGHPEQQR
ncbi:MAG TPA: hypothetical protein VIV40_15740 [Kofleriaceae bacterium]